MKPAIWALYRSQSEMVQISSYPDFPQVALDSVEEFAEWAGQFPDPDVPLNNILLLFIWLVKRLSLIVASEI
jgi:hypothetical protein